MIEWPDFSFRWFAHREGPGDMGHWQCYDLPANDHPSEIPDPPFIAAIDTRKRWEEPFVDRLGPTRIYDILMGAER